MGSKPWAPRFSQILLRAESPTPEAPGHSRAQLRVETTSPGVLEGCRAQLRMEHPSPADAAALADPAASGKPQPWGEGGDPVVLLADPSRLLGASGPRPAGGLGRVCASLGSMSYGAGRVGHAP